MVASRQIVGMKCALKYLIVAVTVVVSTYALVPAFGGKNDLVLSDSIMGQQGVYNTNCAGCHGRDGHANTPKGRELDADDLTTGKVKGMSAAKMSRIIRNGKADMPGFGKKLTATQIAALVRYVKTL